MPVVFIKTFPSVLICVATFEKIDSFSVRDRIAVESEISKPRKAGGYMYILTADTEESPDCSKLLEIAVTDNATL